MKIEGAGRNEKIETEHPPSCQMYLKVIQEGFIVITDRICERNPGKTHLCISKGAKKGKLCFLSQLHC